VKTFVQRKNLLATTKQKNMNNNSTSKTQELAGVSPGTRGLTRDNSRNSRAQQHERRNSIRLLGNVVELDKWLGWRVKWGQRVAGVSLVLGVLFFILNSSLFNGQNIPLNAVTLMSMVGVIIGIGMIYFKNTSFGVARRLLEEVNVVVILVLVVCIFTIDCVKPDISTSPVNGFIYLLGTTLFVFIDAVKKKSRVFVMLGGGIFALLTMWNIYARTFNGDDVGVILFKYGNDYVFRKRSIKRSCFLQIFLFSLNGLWILFKDKKIEMMMFATGNIYRDTIIQVNVNRDNNGFNNKCTTRWGELGIGLFGYISLMGYIFAENNEALRIATILVSLITIPFMALFYYKNTSYMILKRLLKEANIIMILLLALCNFAIDVGLASDSLEYLYGLVYLFLVIFFIFLDATKLKSRQFLLIIVFNFVVLNLFNIYGNTFRGWNQDIQLLQYKIEGEEYTIMKRPTKRSIYFQIVLFSLNGMWTMFKDKKMEKMMFATGSIYRETGTASKYVEDRKYLIRMRSETTESMV